MLKVKAGAERAGIVRKHNVAESDAGMIAGAGDSPCALVDLIRPRQNPTGEILNMREPRLLQDQRGLLAACAGAAMDDDLAVHIVGAGRDDIEPVDEAGIELGIEALAHEGSQGLDHVGRA